jgi:hypothetical protein
MGRKQTLFLLHVADCQNNVICLFDHPLSRVGFGKQVALPDLTGEIDQRPKDGDCREDVSEGSDIERGRQVWVESGHHARAESQSGSGTTTLLFASSGGVPIDAQIEGVNLPPGHTVGAISRKPFGSGANP